MSYRQPKLIAKILMVSPVLSSLVLACSINTKELETAIIKKTKDQGIELKTVDCPPRKYKKGDTFECKAVSSDDDDVVVDVEQTDSAGTVTFKVRGAILNAEKVGDGLEKKIGKAADVKCANHPVLLVDGKKIKCKVTVDGKEHDLSLVAKGDQGDIGWEILN